MMLLLCPECCQWREPAEGRCPVCAGTLDLAVADPPLESLADEISDLHGVLGASELSRAVLPQRGQLWATTNGLLFVPNESRVIVFANDRRGGAAARLGGLGRWMERWSSWLSGREPTARFACERRTLALAVNDRRTLAELLRSDPGVLFWSRRAIASWRRQHGRWMLLRPDDHEWPEGISMRDRDGDRAVQTWLEATACPLPVNVR